jgi:hypothetical protein
MKRALLGIGVLTLLLTAIDQLYRVLHPHVDLERAALVGLTALAALLALARLPLPAALRVPPLPGALAILASASVSVLLIQAGVLVSRSLVSGAVHALLVAAAYPLLREHRATRVRARRQARPT